MAMAKVCLNLTRGQFLLRVCLRSRSRPAPLAAFFSGKKQLYSVSTPTPTTHCLSAASWVSTCRSFSHRVVMEKRGQLSAVSEANWDPEGQGGGGGGPDGNGSGRGSDGGSGGGDDSSGQSKGDDTSSYSLFSWYLVLLNNHPVTTKAITSALLSLFGDLVCQLLIEKSEVIDLKRIGVFTLLGLVLVGPTLHFWYLSLSKLLPGPGPFKAGSRLVLDQFLFSPVFIGVFISAMLTLEGHSYEIAPKLKQDLLSVVVANWKIWIPFQFLNFLFVPQQLQVLAANVIALIWNTYLSFAAHKDVMPPAQEDSFTS